MSPGDARERPAPGFVTSRRSRRALQRVLEQSLIGVQRHHPVAAPPQLADDQEGPVDLPRPGPLAVDVYDVHGPGPPQR